MTTSTFWRASATGCGHSVGAADGLATSAFWQATKWQENILVVDELPLDKLSAFKEELLTRHCSSQHRWTVQGINQGASSSFSSECCLSALHRDQSIEATFAKD